MLAKTSLKWGLLLGIAVSLVTQILTWLGPGLTNWFIVASIVLTIIVVTKAAIEIQSFQEGKFSFVNAIILVLLLVIIARFVFQAYMFVYTRYIDPAWIETVATNWTTMLQESGATVEQINAQMESFKQSYEIVPMFTVTLIMYGIPQFFWGFITTLFFVFDVKGRFQKIRNAPS